ncbi:hypothetical protein CBW16_03645 [Flavobacteriaceae bacterium JJC]|nr:hypothetical protein CBW16_03645 [Flavobacteriaceae bacterium JJC]
MINNKISIIVPVYNVDKYLAACIESIINQTYKNLEIILVNDGSTDASGKIMDDYVLRESRIKAIHQDNAGVAVARNTGLQNVTGHFISFIDADDVIAPHFYETMLRSLIDNEADIVECDFMRFANINEIGEHPYSGKPAEKIYDTAKALELLIKEEIKQMPCNKLFTAEVNKGITFPPGKKHEDDFWAFQVIGNAKRVVQRDEVLYFYRTHVESNMGRPYNLTRLDGLSAIEERICYVKEHFPQLENLATKSFLQGSMWHYQKITKHSEIDSGMISRKNILNKVKAYHAKTDFKGWTFKEKFWYQFFFMAPVLFAKFRNGINIGI